MIKVSDKVWIGNSTDEREADLSDIEVTAILNVAVDMPRARVEHGVEYMHVGLIDGPGNPPAAYAAAVLALLTLTSRHDGVLICCHDGMSRSLPVFIMTSILKSGRVSNGVSSPSRWKTWRAAIDEVTVYTKLDFTAMVIHPCHLHTIDTLPYGILEQLQ